MSIWLGEGSDLTNCPICLETYDKPTSLPCLHSFCLQCIRDYHKDKSAKNNIQCPVCRKVFPLPSEGVGGFLHNFFIQSLIDERKIAKSPRTESEVPCEVCLNGKKPAARNVPKATKYCADCEQKLCERCSIPHKRMREGGHEVIELGPDFEQQLLKLRGSYCSTHKNKRVELYCFSCQENICLKCSIVKHRDHKWAEIAEQASEFKLHMNEDNRQIASRIEEIRRKSDLVGCESSDKQVAAQVERIGEEIKATGETAKQTIDRQVQKRLTELDSVKQKHVEAKQTIKDVLQLELAVAESFLQYSSKLVEKGRPSDVTAAAVDLHARATEILRMDVSSIRLSTTHVIFTPAELTELNKMDVIGELQELTIKEGRLVHTLPESELVYGVTSLGGRLYVLRSKNEDQVEVYDIKTYKLQHCLTVPNLRGLFDMTSCAHFLCLYITDAASKCVHRVEVDGEATTWPINDIPCGISVNANCNVLAVCGAAQKIKEFTSHGDLVRDIALPNDLVRPSHAIQLGSGEFIVCHADVDNPVHRVCKISADGHRIVHSHGGGPGTDLDQYNVPTYLAVDSNETVFVVDVGNKRVTLLSPKLTHVCQMVSSNHFKWFPYRVHLDSHRQRLYVADNKVGDSNAGRVVVFSLYNIGRENNRRCDPSTGHDHKAGSDPGESLDHSEGHDPNEGPDHSGGPEPNDGLDPGACVTAL